MEANFVIATQKSLYSKLAKISKVCCTELVPYDTEMWERRTVRRSENGCDVWKTLEDSVHNDEIMMIPYYDKNNDEML